MDPTRPTSSECDFRTRPSLTVTPKCNRNVTVKVGRVRKSHFGPEAVDLESCKVGHFPDKTKGSQQSKKGGTLPNMGYYTCRCSNDPHGRRRYRRQQRRRSEGYEHTLIIFQNTGKNLKMVGGAHEDARPWTASETRELHVTASLSRRFTFATVNRPGADSGAGETAPMQ